MGHTKDMAGRHADITVVSGLNSKSVTGVQFHMNGIVAVIEVQFSGGSTFIKEQQGQCEVGGNQDWNTGTKVTPA